MSKAEEERAEPASMPSGEGVAPVSDASAEDVIPFSGAPSQDLAPVSQPPTAEPMPQSPAEGPGSEGAAGSTPNGASLPVDDTSGRWGPQPPDATPLGARGTPSEPVDDTSGRWGPQPPDATPLGARGTPSERTGRRHERPLGPQPPDDATPLGARGTPASGRGEPDEDPGAAGGGGVGEGGRSVAHVVASSLRGVLPVWTPMGCASLADQLMPALQSVHPSQDAMVPNLTAAVLAELVDMWDIAAAALLAECLAGAQHGRPMGRGAELATLMRCLLVAGRGCILGTTDAVEPAADLVMALREPPYAWSLPESCELLAGLLLQDAWDPKVRRSTMCVLEAVLGLRALSVVSGSALASTALRRGGGWAVADVTAAMGTLVAGGWDLRHGAAMAAELVGNFGWNEEEVAQMLQGLLGWEAAAVETAADLAVRLCGDQYGWDIPRVVELLQILYEEAEAGAAAQRTGESAEVRQLNSVAGSWTAEFSDACAGRAASSLCRPAGT
ncbi:hypothetical protein CYMTET_27910 [Cymbomonas tetramitiformis]|uniref:Uncharacterized protein n=1 Tax=Cymbomonas tetramitiformis TaxID=36881 RepID=A0AAE0FNU3_9CHLO|nr:hypothetical protein CYMTET_27910 [Cymbomonas tetramitiformis]